MLLGHLLRLKGVRGGQDSGGRVQLVAPLVTEPVAAGDARVNRARSGRVHYVRHLLKQDPVLSLDLRVALYSRLHQ